MDNQLVDWVQKAGREKRKAKVKAVMDAFLADWIDEAMPADRRCLANAFREAINQTQNGQGLISAAELHLLAQELEAQ
jgi:alpha-D-ribose 1-methylphosphonate 5-triphosphate synthase subunit PhnG